MSLSHDEIIKIIAYELAYHRFLGSIAILNKSKQIETLEESERANGLASENWFLYKKDAEDLYDIITGKTEILDKGLSGYGLKEEECKVPSYDTPIGSLDL